jgi:Tol biopolymer transport system component
MQRDIRDTPAYREAAKIYEVLRQPGRGLISDATEVSTHGVQAIYAGTRVDDLNESAPTRIYSTHLESGETRVLTFGPNVDRLPKFSPDGRHIAFLSDRRAAGGYQLHLLDPVSGAVSLTPAVEGWVEHFRWSPDGQRILLAVAGHRADVAGGQGAVKSVQQPVP